MYKMVYSVDGIQYVRESYYFFHLTELVEGVQKRNPKATIKWCIFNGKGELVGGN